MASKEVDFYLGQWVEVTHTLTRKNKYPGETWRKEWVRGENLLQGIVIGVRHLTNGRNDIQGGEVVYTHEEFIVAYLVAYDLKRKPVLALIQDAKELK